MTAPRIRAAGLTGAMLTVTMTLAACGADADGDEGGTRTLDVLAAASLTEPFGALAGTFEEEHPGVEVRLVLESSTTLANQVGEGAPADVLATADTSSMQLVLDAGHAEEADAFATNELVLVTPPDDPAGIDSVADLDDPDVAFLACVDTAPCGALAAQLLEHNDVTHEPRSLEVDVKAVLAKVTSGEADAGLVYATDAQAAGGDVRTIPVPGSEEARNTYHVAVVDQADEPDLAREWVELVLAPTGQDLLAEAGFGPAGRPADR